MRLLHLTSGLMHGEDVKLAQKRLAGDNVFGVDFHPGKQDGQFGESTGAACVRAKVYLGYGPGQIQPSYGEELDGYLKGSRLPLLHRARKRSLPKALGAQALVRARSYIHLTEQPKGSNRQRFGAWYGSNGVPWCAEFVSYCYAQAGSKAFRPGRYYAYVPYIVNDARAGRNGLSITRDPKPGDLVCYDWEHNGVADHVGLFDHWSGNGFVAVEGNTAVGNDSNGGEVMERTRTRNQVQAFVRVGR